MEQSRSKERDSVHTHRVTLSEGYHVEVDLVEGSVELLKVTDVLARYLLDCRTLNELIAQSVLRALEQALERVKTNLSSLHKGATHPYLQSFNLVLDAVS